MTILKTIQTHLKKIEQTEQVHILLAVESGSRAWGFPSPDSDYDVRFIYVHNKEHYLQLQKTSDVIDYMLNDELDINGWDVDKTLRLLRKSNPTLFEWITSPIIYREHAAFSNIRALAQQCFLSKPALHHYFNMASNNNREFLKKDRVRLKKYFYVLRPILACKWILKEQTPPPMLFQQLTDSLLDPSIQPLIEELLAQKAMTSELGESAPIFALDRYIEQELCALEHSIAKQPLVHAPSWGKLNRLFLELLDEDLSIQ